MFGNVIEACGSDIPESLSTQFDTGEYTLYTLYSSSGSFSGVHYLRCHCFK